MDRLTYALTGKGFLDFQDAIKMAKAWYEENSVGGENENTWSIRISCRGIGNHDDKTMDLPGMGKPKGKRERKRARVDGAAS